MSTSLVHATGVLLADLVTRDPSPDVGWARELLERELSMELVETHCQAELSVRR